MTENSEPTSQKTGRLRDAGALLFAAGGLTAAFGAASCCALPLLLGAAGLSSAWLAAIAWFAAPHWIALLAIAIAFLAAGGGLLLQRRRAAACLPAGCAGSPVTTAVGAGVLSLAGLLVVLGIVLA